VHTSTKENPLQIWPTSKVYWGLPCGEIFVKIQSVFPEVRAKLWKNAPSRNIEESLKNLLDPDDIQNVISTSIYIYISGKIQILTKFDQ